MKGPFHGLQKYASKEVKFNQNKSLDSLVFKVAVKNQPNSKGEVWSNEKKETVALTKDGVCAALSMLYISDFLVMGNVKAEFTRGREEPGKGITKNHQIAAKVASIQQRFDGSESMTGLAKEFGLYVDSERTASISELESLDKHVADGQALFIGVNYVSGGGHAVAVTKSSGAIRFFDPNIGGYLLRTGDRRNFVQKWMEVYKDSYNKEIKKITFYFITTSLF